jgi:hypothetical protein
LLGEAEQIELERFLDEALELLAEYFFIPDAFNAS